MGEEEPVSNVLDEMDEEADEEPEETEEEKQIRYNLAAKVPYFGAHYQPLSINTPNIILSHSTQNIWA